MIAAEPLIRSHRGPGGRNRRPQVGTLGRGPIRFAADDDDGESEQTQCPESARTWARIMGPGRWLWGGGRLGDDGELYQVRVRNQRPRSGAGRMSSRESLGAPAHRKPAGRRQLKLERPADT